MNARRIVNELSGPRLFSAVLPVLMIYLIAGTVAQKYIGLYEATNIFFSGLVLWLGPVPLPGLPLLLGLIVVNLALKLFLKSPWNANTAGTIIVHMGVLFLLAGGLFTALFSREGYMDLYEGQEKSFVSDYHERHFVLLDEQDRIVEDYNHAKLNPGHVLHVAEPPVIVRILESCRNCAIERRQDAPPGYRGMAENMKIVPAKLKLQDEENLSGLTVSVEGSDTDGVYMVLDEVPSLPEIEAGGLKMRLALRKARRNIPFSVRLLSFKRELYPGTEMARAYESRIEIIDGAARWQTLVSMNQPVRYKGYTLFQSSFAQTPAGEMSVLAVVENAGRVFPYVSGLAIAFGLILHLLIRGGLFHRRAALIVFFMLISASPVQAQTPPKEPAAPLPMEEFARLPVLHDGRIKPLDSFARATLKKFSGKDHLNNLSAIRWLAETLFDPARTENREVIKILNPELQSLLNLPNRPGNRYSAQEVAKSLSGQKDRLAETLKIPEENRTPAQRDFITLHEHLALLNDVMSGLSLFLPLSAALPDDVPESLKPYAGQTLTYLDTLKFSQTLEDELKKIVEEKGQDIESYTPAQQAVVFLSFSTAGLRQKGKASRILKIIPVRPPGEEARETLWRSPWAVALDGSASPQTVESFNSWKTLAAAYQTGDRDLWREAVKTLNENAASAGDLRQTDRDRLEAEYFYNRIAPFEIGFWFFLATAAALAAYGFTRSPMAQNAAALILGAGVLFHLVGLGLRIYILQRPPVSTLYESILFVSAVATLYALIMGVRSKNALWLGLGAASGIILGLLGFSHDTDADSLMMLTAVLNTSFWLATHVLCITTGYAFSLLTALLAHLCLLRMLRDKSSVPPAALFRPIYATALLALLFCTAGTILGGIWADQSWGRFWGWDPKENGALLLVLWLVWIIHGRLAGQFSPLVFTAGMAYLLAVVAVSWFGVNLLSVGLHAYGFTETAAWLFWSVLIAETAFCVTAILYLRAPEMREAETA